MAELKTRPTGASVARFISAIPDPVRRSDCRTLVSLMKRATGAKAEMWGPSIVGFGRYQLRYASGRELPWPVASFSPRKQALTVYVYGLREYAPLLAKLGKYKASGVCLHLKRLAEVDLAVLEAIIVKSIAKGRALDGSAAKDVMASNAAKRAGAKRVAKPAARRAR